MKRGPTDTIDQRSGEDRRAKPFGNIRWLLRTGRRRQVRRASDQRNISVLDYYPTKLFVLLLAILGLSVVDAFLTLRLIDKGARELNPVMAYYLQQGPVVFMVVKYLLTAAAVTIAAVMHHAFIRILRVHIAQLLKVFAGCFAMVVAWELYLLARLAM